MTLEQVKKYIESGECKMIFYSPRTLWWTHLESDLIEARDMGREVLTQNISLELQKKNISNIQRQVLKGHLEGIKISPTPLDPTGNPLKQMENVKHWVEEAEKKPEHFGKHGLDAFMASHHQNCKDAVPKTWDAINKSIDLKNELSDE